MAKICQKRHVDKNRASLRKKSKGHEYKNIEQTFGCYKPGDKYGSKIVKSYLKAR